MPSVKLTLTTLALAGVLMYTACRKTDQPINRPAPPGNEEQFFTRHASNLPRVQSIVQFMQRENDKYHFVNNLVKKAGYARWDKTLLYRTPSTQVETITNDTTFVAFIPMVLEGGNTVNAQLVVNISPSDTLYRVMGASEYASFGFAENADTSLNALKLFSLFATHERAVFNRTRFEILDNRILQGQSAIVIDTAKRYMVQLDTAAATLSEVMSAPEPELPHSSCITVFDMIEAGYSVVYNMVGSACVISSYSLPGGGGGGGTNGPAGGGGTVNPGPIGGGGTNGPIGWLPVGGGAATPQTEPVDSMLARYARSIDKTADSIFQLSMNSTIKEEWGFPFVQKAGNVYAKRCTTNHKTQIVILDRYVDTGEKIMGECHTHPDTSLNPLNRSAPSGIDLETFNVNSRLGYTLIVECGNVRYALVIENVSLCRAYLAQHYPDELMYEQEVIAMQQSGWQTNWQHATELALIQLLGASNSCGIGFYKSDMSKLNFTKLN